MHILVAELSVNLGLNPIPKRLDLIRLERLVKRTWMMGVQIVHYHRDCFRRCILLRIVAEKVWEVALGAPLGYLDHTRCGQWLCRHKHVAVAHATVLLVHFTRLACALATRLGNQLLRTLVHANHQAVRIVGSPVNI